MSAYKDALWISSTESGARLQVALEVLCEGLGEIVVDGIFALRPMPGGAIDGEVFASRGQPIPTYVAAASSARAVLAASNLAARLELDSIHWIVVEDYGQGVGLLWDSRNPHLVRL